MIDHYSTVNVLVFLVIIAVFLWVDLHAHKKDEPISVRDAAIWSCIWISVAGAFGAYVGVTHGADAAWLYFAGYLLEKSLSVDNLFVIMAIFTAFAIKDKYQHRVLYYGILGALVLRLLFIAAGSTLVEMFGPYALAAFGLFVLWSAWKMWQHMHKPKEDIEDYSDHWSVRFTRRFIPVSPTVQGHDFFVKEPDVPGGKHIWKATPLFLCLIVIELCDVMFAFDSIPAIFAITQEPYLIYTSNIFAILGLRSLYFLMAAASRMLVHLEKAVIIILGYIGIKMLVGVATGSHIPPFVSLAVVIGLLAGGVAASLIWPAQEGAEEKKNGNDSGGAG
ncbi:MAG: Putative membrane-bound redox modulator Alx [Desulfovibrio sp.]